jgi:hypothetical protein
MTVKVEFYKVVTRVLQGCYKSVTKVLSGCLRGYRKDVRIALRDNLAGSCGKPPHNPPDCYKIVTRVLQVCYKSVTRVLLICNKSVE